ncbi:MAG: hypothetical protein ACE5FT_07955 [Candidatus Nanoarchaeia archaeon]
MAELVGGLVTLVIFVPVSALLLMLAAKIFKLHDTSFMTALKVAGILGGARFVLSLLWSLIGLGPGAIMILSGLEFVLISIALSIYLIKLFYEEGWKETLLTWLVWFIFNIILGMLIALVVAAVMLAVFAGATIA